MTAKITELDDKSQRWIMKQVLHHENKWESYNFMQDKWVPMEEFTMFCTYSSGKFKELLEETSKSFDDNVTIYTHQNNESYGAIRPKRYSATLCTGGFDPLHIGHINYFKAAKELTGNLVVGCNSDAWLVRKKGKPFMSHKDRMTILKHLDIVDHVLPFDDDDDTACVAIEHCKELYDSVVFANGGDRDKTNTPEMEHYKDDPKVEFVFGIGGDKVNSSSTIITGRHEKED